MLNARHRQSDLALRAWGLRLRSPLRARTVAMQALSTAQDRKTAPWAALTIALVERWLGNFEQAFTFCDTAEEMLKGGSDYEAMAQLAAIRAKAYLDNGDISEACENASHGLDMLREGNHGAHAARIALMIIVAALHRTADERMASQDILEESLQIAEREALTEEYAWTMQELAMTHYGQGAFAEAEAVAKKAASIAWNLRLRALLPHITATRCAAVVSGGCREDVHDSLVTALGNARRFGDSRAEVKLLAALGQGGLARGEFDYALHKIDEATELATRTGYNAKLELLHRMASDMRESAGDFRGALQSRKAFDLARYSMAKTAAQASLRAMKARADLITAKIEIEAARTTAEDLHARAREAMLASRQKSHFLANMSHELRTPLNGVLGFTQLLQMSKLDEKQKEYADLAVQAGENLLGLINDILDISRIEAGVIALTTDEFSVGALLDQVKATVSGVAQRKGLNLAIDIAECTPRFMVGDRQRVMQVLINFAGNAVKFTDSGTVRLCASAGKNGIRFAVQDDGPGISPEDRTHIFKRFFRTDCSMTRKHEGIGLGLAISSELSKLMNGDIGVDESPSGGAEFWVDLPLEIDMGSSQRTEAVAARA